MDFRVAKNVLKLFPTMSHFKHYTKFPHEKSLQSFRYPHVCFTCRKSYKQPAAQLGRKCPQCGGALTALSRKFSAPKTNDIEQWKKVEFLVMHGFLFQPVHELREDGYSYRANYPSTLAEARSFVITFKNQAKSND